MFSVIPLKFLRKVMTLVGACYKVFRPNIYLRCFTAANGQIKTAGILVIGDEILKGDVTDTNSPCIARDLYRLGVKLKKISVIADEVDVICNEIRLFSKEYNYVITTGGIGPTHDDVTFEAVAKAFGVPLVLNQHLRELCEKFYKTTDINHPGMKLARIPENSLLNFADNTNYPNISINNVYMFPGIPELFLKSFKNLSHRLFKSDETEFFTKIVYVNVTEDKISKELAQLVEEFPGIQVGSYPKMFHDSYKVKIVIESTSSALTLDACNRLLQKIPHENVVAVSS